MSEKITEVYAGPSGLNVRGHVTRDEAVVETRRVWEHTLREAQAVLAALDAGEERVFHQLGIHARRNRRELPREDTTGPNPERTPQ